MDWSALQQPDMIARLVLQVILFALSALFSMSETALFSLRDADIDRLAARAPGQAGRIRALIDEPRRLIVSILCGNELINIAATINLAGIFLALFGDPGTAAIVNIAVMLPLLLILCEITPKTLAVTKPMVMARKLVEPVMTPWVRIVAPVRAAVRLVADRITSLLVGDARSETNILSADEFAAFLHDVEGEGVVTPEEQRLIVNLMQAGATPITQIMVPRPQVSFIDADRSVPEILEAFRNLRHRRVPVYRQRRDTIVGVLKEHRVIDLLARRPVDEITLDELLEPPTLVPGIVTVSEMAELFKYGDHHAAIVVNEFGGVEGLVSADDVFGYLTLGRAIYLEEHAEIEELEDGAWHCAGMTPIGMLRRITNLPLEEDAGIATAGGLVMALLKRVPCIGDSVVDAGLVLRVEAMDGLLVDKVLIAPEGHARLQGGTDAPGARVPEAAE